MEECKICFDMCKIDKIKKIPCGHELCYDCYINLITCQCPFCRKNINYSTEELKLKNSLGIRMNEDFSSNIIYNPNDFAYNQNSNNAVATLQNFDSDTPNFTLSRTVRNRNRRLLRQVNLENDLSIEVQQQRANDRRRRRSKRRRKLTDEEIQEKRRIINLKKKMRYIKREGRLRKTIAWYNNEID